MGMPLTQDITLTDTSFTFNEKDVQIIKDAQQYYDNRVEYQMLQTQKELQQLNQKNMKAGYLPILSAFGNYGYVGSGDKFGLYNTGNNGWADYTSSSIGLTLSWNIFSGFRRDAQIQQSKIQTEQLDQQMKLTKSSIDMEVSNAQAQYMTAIESIESDRKSVV